MTRASSTMRVRPRTRARLRDLAEGEGRSVPDLLDELVERAEDRRMLAQHNAAMNRLRENPDAWAAWKAEVDAWDATLMDGLRDL